VEWAVAAARCTSHSHSGGKGEAIPFVIQVRTR
jgi:hypothetical protein